MSTGALKAIRDRYPKARLVVLTHKTCQRLVGELGVADLVIAYHGGYRGFFSTVHELRRQAIDTAVILHGNEPQATPLAYLSGASHIFKLPNANEFRFLLTNRNPVVSWAAFEHGIQQRFSVAALIDAKVEEERLYLPLAPEALKIVERFLADYELAGGVLVGFQCCASSRSRMWPAAHFIELGKSLAAKGNIRLLLTGAPGERPYLEGIARAIGPAAFNAAGLLALEHLPALVAKCRVMVSGDTGTLHVAVAVGTPVVGLFAVSDPRASGPRQDIDRHIVLHYPSQEFVRSKSDDDRWIARIPLEAVSKAVCRILVMPSAVAAR